MHWLSKLLGFLVGVLAASEDLGVARGRSSSRSLKNSGHGAWWQLKEEEMGAGGDGARPGEHTEEEGIQGASKGNPRTSTRTQGRQRKVARRPERSCSTRKEER